MGANAQPNPTLDATSTIVSKDYQNGSDMESDATSSLQSGPLASLFKSKYDYNSLQYPSDLKSNEKNHYVVFQISEVKQVGYDDVKKKIAEVTGAELPSLKTATEAVKGLVAGVVDVVKNGGENPLAVNPLAVAEGIKNQIEGVITSDKSSPANILETRKNLASTVTLYMPDTLEFSQSAEYSDSDVLTAAAAFAGMMPAPNGKISSAINSLATKASEGAQKVSNLANNAASKLILNKLGYAFNPQQMVLFQGIKFREFPMSFTFTARSAREAEQIQRIIREMRMYAAPTIVKQAAGLFFKPPGIFSISFWSNGKINKNINQVTDCVLKSVDVNYAPNGWSAHNDGKPIQIVMNLQFQEISLVDSDMISKGY